MYRFFLPVPFDEQMEITGPDAHHVSHVLRMKPGDEVQVVSCDQVAAVMKITGFTEKTVSLSLVRKIDDSHEPSVKVTLLQGLPKSDKMEWIIQKAVELGVTDIQPVSMTHCIVRLDENRSARKVERWQKIAEAAAKQSKRDIIPIVHAPIPFERAVRECQARTRILAYEEEETRGLRSVLQEQDHPSDYAVLIGPEGGISGEEFLLAQKAGWLSVSLGPRIMRTETAALAVLTALQYETGNLGG